MNLIRFKWACALWGI